MFVVLTAHCFRVLDHLGHRCFLAERRCFVGVVSPAGGIHGRDKSPATTRAVGLQTASICRVHARGSFHQGAQRVRRNTPLTSLVVFGWLLSPFVFLECGSRATARHVVPSFSPSILYFLRDKRITRFP